MKCRIAGREVELEIEGRVRGGVDADTRVQLNAGSALAQVKSTAKLGRAGKNPAPAPTSQSFFIPGVLPGLNEIVDAAKVRRGSWSRYADMKEAHQAYIVTMIRKAKLAPMNLVTIEFLWHEAKRNRDKDNIAAGKKFICDALKVAGVLKNDGWKNIEGFRDHFTVDRSSPAVTVTLMEVGR